MDGFLKFEVLRGRSSDVNDDETSIEKQLEQSKVNIGKELDKLFPPRRVKSECGDIQTKQVSRNKATLFEIYTLGKEYDETVKNLEEEAWDARSMAVHGELFNELIRQEIVDCPEKGLMLANVRKEASETLNTVQKLYRSGFAYAVTKDLLEQRDILQKRNEIPKFMAEIDAATKTLQNMRDNWQERKRIEEELEVVRGIESTFKENQLVIANRQMVNQIEDIIDTEHKWLKDLD